MATHHTRRWRPVLLVGGLLSALGLASCGPGVESYWPGDYPYYPDDPGDHPSGGTIVEHGSGRISSSDPAMSDGSHYDAVEFDLDWGSYQVDMTRSGSDPVLDPYLIVYRIDGEELERVAEDDDSGYGVNARAWFDATGDRYLIVFNTYDSNDFGTYGYTIRRDSDWSATNDAADKPVARAKPAVRRPSGTTAGRH